MSIIFTQYHRPNGKTTQMKIGRPKAIEDKANEIIKEGFRFEVEELNTRPPQISMTVCDDERGDIAIKICAKDGAVPEAVDLLVREAYLKVLGYRNGKPRSWDK